MSEVIEIKSEVHSIKGLRHVWKIENSCDVNVLRTGTCIRVALLPFDKNKARIFYEKDVSELNYSEQVLKQEVDNLAQLLKGNDEFVKFWYEFTFRTGMLSLGMALISYHSNPKERERYEQHLKRAYRPNIPLEKIRNGERI